MVWSWRRCGSWHVMFILPNWLDGFHSPRDTVGSHHPLTGFFGRSWDTCQLILLPTLQHFLAWVYHVSWQDWKPPHHDPFPLLICFSDASPFPWLILLTTSGSLIFSGFQRGYQNQPFLRSSFLKGVTHFKTERIWKQGIFWNCYISSFQKTLAGWFTMYIREFDVISLYWLRVWNHPIFHNLTVW